jgi:hypothetical protein
VPWMISSSSSTPAGSTGFYEANDRRLVIHMLIIERRFNVDIHETRDRVAVGERDVRSDVRNSKQPFRRSGWAPWALPAGISPFGLTALSAASCTTVHRCSVHPTSSHVDVGMSTYPFLDCCELRSGL